MLMMGFLPLMTLQPNEEIKLNPLATLNSHMPAIQLRSDTLLISAFLTTTKNHGKKY